MEVGKNYREAIIALIREQALPVEKYGHQPRLYALALAVAGALEFDDDVLFAAAWLHDLGVFAGHRPEDPALLERWDSKSYAVNQVPDILTSLGFPGAKIGAVTEAIRAHQPADDPASVEGIILRDADILEQLGAIGIMRTVCKVGRDTRFTTFSAALGSLRRAVETLPAQLRLPTARELARPRIQVMKSFLDALVGESGDLLF